MANENLNLLNLLKESFVSSYEFTQALSTLSRGESVLWNSCVGSSYALIAGAVSDKLNRPVIVVVSKVGMVEKTALDLKLFTDAPILSYPILTESGEENPEEVFPSEDADFGARLRVLKALGDRARNLSESSIKDCKDFHAPIVVSTLAAILQSTPSRDQIIAESVSLKVGDVYSLEKLRDWLAEGGFVREPAVEHTGEFSIRGDICDVFALDWENPIRIEFFGDQVESIRFFDVVDQRKISELNAVSVSRLKTLGTSTSTFLDHLPNDAIVLIWEPDLVIAETTKLVSNSRSNFSGPSGRDQRRLSIADAMNALYRRPTIHAVNIASGAEPAQISLEGSFFSVDRLCGDVSSVDGSLKQLADDERVILVCASDAESTRLQNAFTTSQPGREGRIGFSVGTLAEGFEWRPANTLIVGTDQLFSRAISRRTRSSQGSREIRKTIDSIMELEPGDLVVHVDHGIARYRGIEQIKRLTQVEDHLRLEFDGGKALLVPVSQISKIQRYFGVGGARKVNLSRLSGKTWSERKERVRQSVIQYAAQMLEVQAARETLCGISFDPNGEMLRGFESTFPYRETEDQLTALDSVATDMEKIRPMDRLLCGDVGFGKTEVAMRAAIKAVESGYQVAILAPTTVLTEQHYRTFVSRAVQLPIKIATLSRFSKKEEMSETLEKIKMGEIDIVVGTHRLLSKDVQFKKLGLVIIDEEQKFGVRHKEQLKHLHNTVDILTMTATPIPRTLHMAMLGIRDISNLETPPEDRLPVETRIVRSNDQITRRAILRELNRGGQVYYLHNRVADIEAKASELRALVPEASIVVGHAQMATSALERIMRDFVMHKFDVLLCTTIIESGVDIPNANTIFIDNADRFGVAELHQLRGRVGREKKQAYCYLYIEPNKQLSGVATRRLRALEQYAKLGSGFQIALKDLEIRGAGNILGVEQSGSLEAVGYEMYCDMLDAVVRSWKKKPQKINVEVKIDLGCTVFLPDKYISDDGQRIDVYRRLARASTKAQVQDLYDEVCDRFGKPPHETQLLFEQAFLRIEAFTFRTKRISLEDIVTPQGNRKKLAIDFRASDLMYRLQEILEKRGLVMGVLVDSLRGYVDFPPDVFDSKGSLNDVSLINFVRSLFVVPKGDRQLEKYTAEAAIARSEEGYSEQDNVATDAQSLKVEAAPGRETNSDSNSFSPLPQKGQKKETCAPLAGRLKALRNRNK